MKYYESGWGNGLGVVLVWLLVCCWFGIVLVRLGYGFVWFWYVYRTVLVWCWYGFGMFVVKVLGVVAAWCGSGMVLARAGEIPCPQK